MATGAQIPRSALQTVFSEQQQKDLAEEDRQAWRQVTGILIAIVVAGTLGGALTVALISL